MSNKEYSLLNLLFVALLICLFAACFFIDTNDLVVSCQVLKSTGDPCKSCGLTRDFVAFTNLNFANPVNDQSFVVFIWFAIQLLVRTMLVSIPSRLVAKVMHYDLAISVISAITVFFPFWI